MPVSRKLAFRKRPRRYPMKRTKKGGMMPRKLDEMSSDDDDDDDDDDDIRPPAYASESPDSASDSSSSTPRYSERPPAYTKRDQQALKAEQELPKALGIMSCEQIRIYIEKSTFSKKEKEVFIRDNLRGSRALKTYIKEQNFSLSELKMFTEGGKFIMKNIEKQIKTISESMNLSGEDKLDKGEGLECEYLQNILDNEGNSNESESWEDFLKKKLKEGRTSKSKNKRGNWSRIKSATRKVGTGIYDLGSGVLRKTRDLAARGNIVLQYVLSAGKGVKDVVVKTLKYFAGVGFQIWTWISTHPLAAMFAIKFLNKLKTYGCEWVGEQLGIVGTSTSSSREAWFAIIHQLYPNDPAVQDEVKLSEIIRTKSDFNTLMKAFAMCEIPSLLFTKGKELLQSIFVGLKDFTVWALSGAFGLLPFIGATIKDSIAMVLSTGLTAVIEAFKSVWSFITGSFSQLMDSGKNMYSYYVQDENSVLGQKEKYEQNAQTQVQDLVKRIKVVEVAKNNTETSVEDQLANKSVNLIQLSNAEIGRLLAIKQVFNAQIVKLTEEDKRLAEDSANLIYRKLMMNNYDPNQRKSFWARLTPIGKTFVGVAVVVSAVGTAVTLNPALLSMSSTLFTGGVAKVTSIVKMSSGTMDSMYQTLQSNVYFKTASETWLANITGITQNVGATFTKSVIDFKKELGIVEAQAGAKSSNNNNPIGNAVDLVSIYYTITEFMDLINPISCFTKGAENLLKVFSVNEKMYRFAIFLGLNNTPTMINYRTQSITLLKKLLLLHKIIDIRLNEADMLIKRDPSRENEILATVYKELYILNDDYKDTKKMCEKVEEAERLALVNVVNFIRTENKWGEFWSYAKSVVIDADETEETFNIQVNRREAELILDEAKNICGDNWLSPTNKDMGWSQYFKSYLSSESASGSCPQLKQMNQTEEERVFALQKAEDERIAAEELVERRQLAKERYLEREERRDLNRTPEEINALKMARIKQDKYKQEQKRQREMGNPMYNTQTIQSGF